MKSHINVDLDNMSHEELQQLSVDAASRVEKKKQEALAQAYKDAEAIAKKFDLTLEGLIEAVKGKRRTTAAAGARNPVPVRYRNPENHNETWTGRGKKPRWLSAKIASGETLESFAV